uniref:Telomerase reverse transcriptase n=1 Tax=Allium cepa TaxID=4679 RepID=A0A0U4BYN1_ALLCE|nr:telomerase reverse transcriptase [Allium cepa]
MAGKRKRNKPPYFLTKIYEEHNTSRKLLSLQYVISSLHPSPTQCRCRSGDACLGCGGIRHLVRAEDSSTYKYLVRKSFCILNSSAPEPPKLFHRVGWQQRQIVRHVIEESSMNNVLSSGYDQSICFSSIGETLCTDAWNLLLERIGDHIMIFLLRHSSIFLPLTNKSYQQVTGPILSRIVQGETRKRKWNVVGNKIEKPLHERVINPFCNDNFSSGKISKGGDNSIPKKHTRLFSWYRRRKHKKINQKDPAENEIDRGPIFYKTISYESNFPKQHILNKVKPTNSGATLLMEHIFGKSIKSFQSCINDKSQCTGNSKCMYHHFRSLLKSLIKNAKWCKCRELMLRHCLSSTPVQCSKAKNNYKHPLKSGSKGCSKSLVEISTEKKIEDILLACGSDIDLNECYSSHHQVVSFIWAVIRSIIPSDLLGNSSNMRALTSNISKFISLRRFEKFNIKQCLHGLKISELPFSHFRPFRYWIYWLFSCFIAPVVGTNFYVTERQFGRHQVYYYPKPVWKKMTNNAISKLKEKNYVLYPSWNSAFSKKNFVVSKVRLLPKKNKLRILANAKAPVKIYSRTGSRSFFVKSVNTSLKELHSILRRVQLENPEALGSSVFGYSDVHQKLYQFLIDSKFRSSMNPKVYIVVGDVAKAFDTINQDKLIKVINDIMLKDNYNLRSYMRVLSGKIQARTVKDHVVYDQHNFCNDVFRCEATTRSRSFSGVIIDQGEYKLFRKGGVKDALANHLKGLMLLIGNNLYSQRVGICQGSSISTLLCSFYLGHLERNIILPYLDKIRKKNSNETINADSTSPKNLLMRWTDDFLFISTSKLQATSFFRRMERGFKEYNCEMNKRKFRLNFDAEQSHSIQNCPYIGMDGIQFLPWSGLLINCQTLEVQADYTRYIGIPISSTITVELNDKALSSLKAKLCQYMRPKCHALFYDSRINSSRVVRLNAYQAFLICAMKFHCYVHCIADYVELCSNSLLNIIEPSFSFMYSLIKKQMRKVRANYNISPKLELNHDDVIWLGLSAYIWVLRKKQSRYKELLSLLKSKISTYGRLSNDSDSLQFAVNDSHSSVFQKIRF